MLMIDSCEHMIVSAAILCPAVCVSDIKNKSDMFGKSMKITSQLFPSHHWQRANLHNVPHTCTYTHTRTYVHASIHTHTCTYTHPHARTHACACTHTYTCTDSQQDSLKKWDFKDDLKDVSMFDDLALQGRLVQTVRCKRKISDQTIVCTQREDKGWNFHLWFGSHLTLCILQHSAWFC